MVNNHLETRTGLMHIDAYLLRHFILICVLLLDLIGRTIFIPYHIIQVHRLNSLIMQFPIHTNYTSCPIQRASLPRSAVNKRHHTRYIHLTCTRTKIVNDMF